MAYTNTNDKVIIEHGVYHVLLTIPAVGVRGTVQLSRSEAMRIGAALINEASRLPR